MTPPLLPTPAAPQAYIRPSYNRLPAQPLCNSFLDPAQLCVPLNAEDEAEVDELAIELGLGEGLDAFAGMDFN